MCIKTMADPDPDRRVAIYLDLNVQGGRHPYFPSCRLHRLSGYAQSKWVSEQLVLAAIRKGLLAGNMSRLGSWDVNV